MRELGPVKEPDDEKSPKKKALKGGFLASWMRRENSGEPDAKLDEQDLVDPEQDALFNDGFSKRWHKLFSGTMPADDTSAALPVTDDQTTSEPKKSETQITETKTVAEESVEDAESMANEAREQVMKAAKSAEELKGEVEVQHDADNLTDKEITAAVPANPPIRTTKKGKKQKPAPEPIDFDVFADKDETPRPASSKVVDFEDIESTPPVSATDLPQLKDNADSLAINVNPMHTGDPFPRVDPTEYAHQTDPEDNVDAPGAPTKGYRGLLVIDHPDRPATVSAKPVSPPPTLPPQPEAFLPAVTAPVVTPASGMPASSPSYVLPPKDPTAWPNPKHSRPVAGGSYTGPRLDRQLQAIIDRPVSPELTQLVDTISELNRQQSEQHRAAQAGNQPAALSHNETIAIPKSSVAQAEEPVVVPQNTEDSDMNVADDALVSSQTRSKQTDGATPLGTILKESPLADKVAKPEPNIQPQPEIEAVSVQATPEPASALAPPAPTPKPAPAPLYTPPAPRTQFSEPAAAPRLNLPVLPQPSKYQIAMQRGILSGLAVSGAIIAAYLFG